MGKIFREYISNKQVFACSSCATHISSNDDLVSTSFTGRFGKAYLFNIAVNIDTGPEQVRMLLSGEHTIADVHCVSCHAYLGWKYLRAAEQENEYKIGKCILETAQTVVMDGNAPRTGWL
eukprot:m.96459 g.96459  ORF g.96459 m.96459 type:complete len:120 (-) comp16658_c0_seq1:171-530(-)